MKAALVQAHLWVARLILGALLLQVFFAGLGIFGAASFVPHARLGFMIVFAAAILLILALAARADRGRSALLFALLVVQVLVVELRGVSPLIAALHPVNALALIALAWDLARGRRAAAAPTVPGRDVADGADRLGTVGAD